MTDLFYAFDGERPRDRHRREKAAKRVCADCPVAEQCLQAAIENREKGIWGGTTELERARMQRRTLREAIKPRLAIPVTPKPQLAPHIPWRVIEARLNLSGIEIKLLIADNETNWHGFQFAVHRADELVFLADDEPDAWLYFHSLVMA